MGLFLLAPLVVVAGVSLNAKKRLFFPPEGLSLRWYLRALEDPGWRQAIENSLLLAALAALVAVSVALPVAYLLWQRRLRLARTLFVAGVAPFMLPPVITALGLMIFWATLGLYGRFENLVLSHGIFLVALPLITLKLGFDSIDPEVVEAARTLGADDRRLFATVLWPLVRPYALSGYAFAFVLSLNEYIIAYMVAGFTVETLPIKIFNALRYGYSPVMAAVAVGFVLVAGLVFGLFARFGDLPRMMGRLR